MAQWHRNIQDIITIIDTCIHAQQDEALTLRALAQKLGYSEYYTSRKFRELAGMTLRDYLRLLRLAFALRDVRDTDMGILDIAVQYGFSSNEAFTRAFKKAYGVSPSAYRTAPGPVVLRTILRPFDCYLTEGAGSLSETQSAGEVQTYFVHIPPHSRISFCTSATMRASATGTSGSGRVRFPVKTARQSAPCSQVSPASSTMRAEKTTMRAAASSWPESTSRRGASAAGASRWRRPTVCACRQTTPGRCRRRCSSWMCPAESTSCSSTGHLILRRRTPP